jgi:hypothetical protein
MICAHVPVLTKDELGALPARPACCTHKDGRHFYFYFILK